MTVGPARSREFRSSSRSSSRRRPPVAPGVPKLSDCRVLVVDDRSEIRFLAKQFIEKSRGRASKWPSTETTRLRIIERSERRGEPFDIVLLDMQMPVKDGYTTARELRARGFRQPIIAVTAHAMQGDRQRCLDVGCNDYTPKPLEQRRLLELISQYYRKPVLRGPGSETEPSMSDRTFDLSPHHGVSPASRQVGNAASRPKMRAAVRPRRSQRVLLVDDSVDACLAQSMLLSMRGYDVQTATSGRDALVAYEKFKPDIVLMDLGMPEMSGYDVVRQLRGKPGVRPVSVHRPLGARRGRGSHQGPRGGLPSLRDEAGRPRRSRTDVPSGLNNSVSPQKN